MKGDEIVRASDRHSDEWALVPPSLVRPFLVSVLRPSIFSLSIFSPIFSQSIFSPFLFIEGLTHTFLQQ